MATLQQECNIFTNSRKFEIFITVVILVNSFLIGVQTMHNIPVVNLIQQICLYIFTAEVCLRYIAAGSISKYFKEGWNIFDLVLVIIGWIPESVFINASTITAIRVLRVFRVLRLLRTMDEVKLIISVLVRSLRSLLYNGILFFIFMYLFAVAGVSMFRLPDPNKLSGDELAKYEQLIADAPHSPANSPDPFGNIGEAFFTLFRALTGEDWTDLRYNLVTASDYGLVSVSPTVVTIFHVSWFCIAAFLLLNLVTGAVINNYQVSIEEAEHKKKKEEETVIKDEDDGVSTVPGLG